MASQPKLIESEARLEQVARPSKVRLAWCAVPVSMRTLAKLLDGLILLCAVLFFAVMAMAITKVLPSWPIAIAMAIGFTAIFVALYWFLFGFWIGSTPGEHLARMAGSEPGNESHFKVQDITRFR
jgi:hypothetical protein